MYYTIPALDAAERSKTLTTLPWCEN